jgi:hypothetical protein
MSTSNTGLILHLNFAEITDGKLEDASSKDNDATPLGHPLIIPDDTFGSCLSLDGADDYVSVPDLAADYAGGLTVEAWVFYSSFKSWSRIIDFGNGPSTNNFLLANAGTTNNLAFHVYAAGAAKTVEAPGVLKTDAWLHVAAVVDAAGGATLYVNGAPVKTGASQLPQKQARSNNYIGRSNWAADGYLHGKVASVRVYNRALSAAEIRQDMADDQTASAAFRASYPLTFKLFDREDSQQVIYITDLPQGREMSFEVSNTSRKAVTLPAPASAQVSAQNYHLELRLRAGTLSADALRRLALTAPGWSMLKPAPDQATQNGGGSFSIYFLSAAEQTLNPGDRISMKLSGVAAEPGPGARGTRAELRFKGLHYPGEVTPLDGTRIQHLNVVNQRGQKTIPLHVGFLDSNTVLNDGASQNQLRLRITNVSKNSLTLTPTPSEAASKLLISFDARGNTEQGKDWALGIEDQVNSIQVNAPGWTYMKPEAKTPEWIFTTTKPSLAPGEAFELTLSGIKTSLPSGMTNMYVRYENIPGHWDGQFVATIEKAPIVYRGDKVGVGASEPKAKLQVSGGAIMPSAGNTETSGIMFPKDPGGGSGDAAWMRYYARQGEAMTLELGVSNDADDHLALMPSGNVGVGTKAPAQRLHVDGGSEVLSTGSGAGYKFRDRGSQTVNDWVWYSQGSVARFHRVNVGDLLSINNSGNVGVGTLSPSAKLSVNGTLSVTASDTSPGSTRRVFEGRIDNGQTKTFDLYTLRSHRSSHLELLVMMHDINSDTFRLYQKTEYGCYKEWNNAPKIDALATVFRRAYSQDIYRAEVVAQGDTIQVRISQNGFATNTVYQIVATYMMVGL